MTRFFCVTLLFLIVLPMFAQEPPLTVGQPVRFDPATLLQTREKLSADLRETRRVLSSIDPNDAQLVEILQTRQADQQRQLNDVVRQLQTPPNIDGGWSGPEFRSEPLPTRSSVLPVEQGSLRSSLPTGMPGMPMPQTLPPGMPNGPVNPYSSPVPYPVAPPEAVPFGMPLQQWNNQQALEASHWGPRLPRELTEVRQSVELLQREVVALRETVKALETQIQLLNRTVLLSSERVNDWKQETVIE